MSKDDRCGDCRFWTPDYEGSVTGECRALPPIIAGQLHELPDDLDPWDAIWPTTRDSQWCGKFELSDEASYRRSEAQRQRMIDMRNEEEKSC